MYPITRELPWGSEELKEWFYMATLRLMRARAFCSHHRIKDWVVWELGTSHDIPLWLYIFQGNTAPIFLVCRRHHSHEEWQPAFGPGTKPFPDLVARLMQFFLCVLFPHSLRFLCPIWHGKCWFLWVVPSHFFLSRVSLGHSHQASTTSAASGFLSYEFKEWNNELHGEQKG